MKKVQFIEDFAYGKQGSEIFGRDNTDKIRVDYGQRKPQKRTFESNFFRVFYDKTDVYIAGEGWIELDYYLPIHKVKRSYPKASEVIHTCSKYEDSEELIEVAPNIRVVADSLASVHNNLYGAEVIHDVWAVDRRVLVCNGKTIKVYA